MHTAGAAIAYFLGLAKRTAQQIEKVSLLYWWLPAERNAPKGEVADDAPCRPSSPHSLPPGRGPHLSHVESR